MATRRSKIAHSAIRRVKRNNASKNVRHKLKTHRRRHRKIVMRGGAGNYNAHYYFKDGKTDGLKCVLVQEAMKIGTKDTVLMFWPVYVTDDELQTMLRLYIKPGKIKDVLDKLVEGKPEFVPTIESMALPTYLKLSSVNPGINSKYNPTITVKSLVDDTSVEITDALIEPFDREKLKKDLGTFTKKGLVGQDEDSAFKDAVKYFIGMYSNSYVENLCKDEYKATHAAHASTTILSSSTKVPSSTATLTWCMRHLTGSHLVSTTTKGNNSNSHSGYPSVLV